LDLQFCSPGTNYSMKSGATPCIPQQGPNRFTNLHHTILCPSKSIKNAAMSPFTPRMGFSSYRKCAPFRSPWHPSSPPQITLVGGRARRQLGYFFGLIDLPFGFHVTRSSESIQIFKVCVVCCAGKRGLVAWMTWSSGSDGLIRALHTFGTGRSALALLIDTVL
jgi:hypothetical protein